ncbi:MAG: hypothetical protein IBX57_00185 [Gammaproteobacteria bacterium]|nr:hypothetical protein [Gammaproteobacteria bacterium]
MSRIINYVVEREKGAVPISIPTSLALEGIFAFGEYESLKPTFGQVDELWINLRTLFRNFLNSIDREVHQSLVVEQILDFFIEDINIVMSTVDIKSSGRVKTKFYLPLYEHKELVKLFPHANIKQAHTPKQLFEKNFEDSTLGAILSMSDSIFQEGQFETLAVKLKGGPFRAALLTHYPLDLLWRSKFTDLFLLESHTGKLKSKNLWHSKLTGGNKLNRIPFNKLTIQVFGDNSTMFNSLSPKLKKALIELSERYKWTPVTTMDKVTFNIQSIKDAEIKEQLLELSRG